MSRRSSPGAVSALGRVSAHIAKAILELRQAERELETVRGLGVLGPKFLTDVGVFKVLGEHRERLLELTGRADAGLRLISETPEEGPQ